MTFPLVSYTSVLPGTVECSSTVVTTVPSARVLVVVTLFPCVTRMHRAKMAAMPKTVTFMTVWKKKNVETE